jgi:NADH-quinone oxidoreductase subunit J
MDWSQLEWLDFAPLVPLAAGVWWLMPRRARWPKPVGLLLVLAGTFWLAFRLGRIDEPLDEVIPFSLFACAAIVCAVLMITNRNPVYSALWFALATLSTCGLFLLQYAAFLAAATIIVYAGAIVVTFVFVIMLAQQSGATIYDQRSRQPLIATVGVFVLLAALVATLKVSSGDPLKVEQSERPAVVANPLSQPTGERLGMMNDLGRALFGDYLFAVELAGTLLLVATIGAIAIAPRRSRGTL